MRAAIFANEEKRQFPAKPGWRDCKAQTHTRLDATADGMRLFAICARVNALRLRPSVFGVAPLLAPFGSRRRRRRRSRSRMQRPAER